MTSRSETSRSDSLDVLIRCALRGRMAGAVPPPSMWGRIRARVERVNVFRRALLGMGLDMPLKAVAAWLSWVDKLLPIYEAPTAHAGEHVLARCDPRWALLDQHRMVMRLVC